MSSNPPGSPGDLLEAAKASPAAVAVHDKQAWLGLFATDAEINDPMGSRPHATPKAIDRFYETFIAPNNIRFVVDQDIVTGNTVVRDVTIMTEMPTGLVVGVPTHIRYEMTVDDSGEPRIQRLSAHWELIVMVLRTLGTGMLGLRTYMKLSWGMIRCQGLWGVLGFMRGFSGVGGAGKRRAEVFLAALRDGDTGQAKRYFAPAYSIELPAGEERSINQLMSLCQGMSWRKLMAAGMYVSATVRVGAGRGVLFLRMDWRKRIVSAVFYLTTH